MTCKCCRCNEVVEVSGDDPDELACPECGNWNTLYEVSVMFIPEIFPEE